MPARINTRNSLYVKSRREWRSWLRRHYRSEREVWLIYYRKETGKPRIAYNDAVEEALCFGWIDSTVRRIDEERFAQRFSPRNPRSPYSQANQERLKKLIKQRKVVKEVFATLGPFRRKRFRIPPDILEAIKADEEAWKNYRKFSPTYKRIRIAFIEGARKRPREFEKRLAYFIRMTSRNKQFGFGGIKAYY